MIDTTYIFILILIIGLFILNEKYNKKKENFAVHDNSSIQQYILNEKSLEDKSKPILWIHVPYDYNTRNWKDFMSRSSTELNQPYL